MLLAAHCDENEPEQLDLGRSRYCHNAVIAELVDFLWAHAQPIVTNRHDICERWYSNVEIWIARDQDKAQGISFYDLALRQAPRALLRASEKDLYWRSAPEEPRNLIQPITKFPHPCILVIAHAQIGQRPCCYV